MNKGFSTRIYIFFVVYTCMGRIDRRLLLVPGYVVGLGGLTLITIRTVLAVMSSGKAVTVQVNRFGEQYVDLILLGMLWVICLVGVWSLSLLLKDQSKGMIRHEQRKSVPDDDNLTRFFVGGDPGIPSENIALRSSGYVYPGEGQPSYGSSVSVMVFQENIQMDE
jgi:hypothetical protein